MTECVYTSGGSVLFPVMQTWSFLVCVAVCVSPFISLIFTWTDGASRLDCGFSWYMCGIYYILKEFPECRKLRKTSLLRNSRV